MTTTKIDIAGELDLIEDWWAGDTADRPYLGEKPFRIVGTVHDQAHLPGVDNPYWEILRHYPSTADGRDGITPEPWAAAALNAYRGDLVIYAGEGPGGCCADDDFFDQLDTRWEPVAASPHHRTWWGIHCRLTAYRRAAT